MSAWDDAISLVCDGDSYIRGNCVYTRNLFTLEDFLNFGREYHGISDTSNGNDAGSDGEESRREDTGGI